MNATSQAAPDRSARQPKHSSSAPRAADPTLMGGFSSLERGGAPAALAGSPPGSPGPAIGQGEEARAPFGVASLRLEVPFGGPESGDAWGACVSVALLAMRPEAIEILRKTENCRQFWSPLLTQMGGSLTRCAPIRLRPKNGLGIDTPLGAAPAVSITAQCGRAEGSRLIRDERDADQRMEEAFAWIQERSLAPMREAGFLLPWSEWSRLDCSSLLRLDPVPVGFLGRCCARAERSMVASAATAAAPDSQDRARRRL